MVTRVYLSAQPIRHLDRFGRFFCEKKAEPIEILFGIWTRVDAGKHVLDGGAHWRNVANTIEPFLCGGDAAFLSNYTLTTCLEMRKNCKVWFWFDWNDDEDGYTGQLAEATGDFAYT